VNLPAARYATGAERARFVDRYLERLRTLPGVEGAAAASWLPANGMYHSWGVSDYGTPAGEGSAGAQVRVVQGDYFDVLGIERIRGRTFGTADRLDSDPVAMVSQALARQMFAERDPIGERFSTGGTTFRIVGVVADVAYDPRGATMGMVYLSHTQFANDRNWAMTYLVRTTDQPTSLATRARQALTVLDASLVLYQPRSLDTVLGGHRARDRFTLLLMAVFAGIAVSLAAIGVYGVLAHNVSQREQEIGIRLALGARPGQMRGSVIRRAGAVAGLGLLIGLGAAYGLSRFLTAIVFEVSVTDPLVFVGAALGLALVILVAAYVPARRATRLDPLTALRRGA
jgi:predicted permease